MTEIIYQGKYSDIILPDNAHITIFDGGHLVVKPHQHVADTCQITEPKAILEMHFLKAQARVILTQVHSILYPNEAELDFFNEQENGNWSALKPDEDQHAHIQIYGRARNAVDQPFGTALNFSAIEARDRKAYIYNAKERDLFKDITKKTIKNFHETTATALASCYILLR